MADEYMSLYEENGEMFIKLESADKVQIGDQL